MKTYKILTIFVLVSLTTIVTGSLPYYPLFGQPLLPAAAVFPVTPKFVKLVPQSVPPHAYSVNIVTRALTPPSPFLLPPYAVQPTQPLIPSSLNYWRRSTAILDDSFTGEDEPNKIKGNRIHPSDTPSRFEATFIFLISMALICEITCDVETLVSAPVIIPYASSYEQHSINHAIAPVAAPVVAGYTARIASAIPAAYSALPAAYSLPYPYTYPVL
ncbi:hypothetical protein PGB90_006121 [Kerria lacca]